MWVFFRDLGDMIELRKEGVDHTFHRIPYAAFGTWGALLGTDDLGLILGAILAEAHEGMTFDWELRHGQVLRGQSPTVPVSLAAPPVAEVVPFARGVDPIGAVLGLHAQEIDLARNQFLGDV